MTFLIKGGYDVFRKQILNVSLTYNNIWTNGLITVSKNIFVSRLIPLDKNIIEIVKYNEMHALLLNNVIIYENKKLFTFKIELKLRKQINKIEDNTFVDYQYLDYPDLKHFNKMRVLN